MPSTYDSCRAYSCTALERRGVPALGEPAANLCEVLADERFAVRVDNVESLASGQRQGHGLRPESIAPINACRKELRLCATDRSLTLLQLNLQRLYVVKRSGTTGPDF